MANWNTRNQSRANKQVLGDSINLLSKGKKKRQWKVKTAVEQEEDGLKADPGYVKPPFDCDKIYKLISDIVEKAFIPEDEEAEYVYSADNNIGLCQSLSKQIRDSLKTWRNLMRYRIIAVVSVIEKQHQGVQYKMKYSIDPKTDNFVKYYFDNPHFFIIICVMLVYQD